MADSPNGKRAAISRHYGDEFRSADTHAIGRGARASTPCHDKRQPRLLSDADEADARLDNNADKADAEAMVVDDEVGFRIESIVVPVNDTNTMPGRSVTIHMKRNTPK